MTLRPAFALALFAAAVALAQSREAPSYSAASIVNAASNEAGAVAPYSLITIYGRNLAFVTRAIGPDDLRGNSLPTVLPNTGVRVWLSGIPAAILFVSPTQINALVPANLRPGLVELQVSLDNLVGPRVVLELVESAPGVFLAGSDTPIAARPDGRLATRDDPLRPGEWVTLYATGLGLTVPPPTGVQIANGAARLEKMPDFEILLNGEPIPLRRVGYAGLAPGFAGLYQINVQIPDEPPADPELRLGVRGRLSRPGLRIPLRR